MKKIFCLLSSVMSLSANAINNLDSGQITYPDSRHMNLIGTPTSTSRDAKYSQPLFKTPRAQILDEGYDNLPTCPTTPSCPDINGKMPNGTTPTTLPPATCPDYCKVTRKVSFQTYNITFFGMSIATVVTKIMGTTPAICPPDYGSFAVYKMDKEILYKTNTRDETPEPYPIKAISTYDQYLQQGYLCDLIPQYSPVESCGGKLGVTLNQRTYIQPPGFGMDSVTGVGVYTAEIKDIYCYWFLSPGTCGGSVFPISCNPQEPTSAKYYYPYSLYKCYPPPGLYYGVNMVPTGLVCSHIQPTWESHH